MSQREFAQRHHLRLSTLQRWVARSREERPTVPASELWQEVKLPAASSAPRWAIELVRSDGLTVRLTPEAPAALVAKLARVLGC